MKFLTAIFSLLFIFSTATAQQSQYIKGIVSNEFTKEPIPFASMYWKVAGFGVLTDSAGGFKLRKSTAEKDTLIASYIGYDKVYRPFNESLDTGKIVIVLKTAKASNEVVIKSKSTRGLRWWKNIVAHKPENNPYKYESYSYELYTKLELDLNNVNRNSFQSIKLLRPFAFILDNIDSVTEKRPFLPVFITETLSDYYRSKNPEKTREIIKAAQTHGLKNESMLQFISGANQKINIYQDYMNLYGKEFISPISGFGDKYYYYKAADTQKVNGEKYFHLFFKPLRDGENTFDGECWIHSTTWAIQKISINLSQSADINFVNRMSVIQEFTRMKDGHWIFAKDKVIVDVSPFRKDKLTFIARKSSLYKDVKMDVEEIEKAVALNKTKDEVIVDDSARDKERSFWDDHRHEELSKNEKKIFWMIDTLKQVPLFKKLTNTVEFIVDGHKKYGKIEIGPWFKWISFNALEGLRTRFDLGTTDKFSKYLRLNGYLAYGFKDQKFKQKIGFTYKIPKSKGFSIAASYTNDLDNGRVRYSDDESTQDNVFNQILRRRGIPIKFLGYQEFKASITKEWPSNFGITTNITNTNYSAFRPLPSTLIYEQINSDKLTNTEFLLKFRYAPGERKFVTHRKNTRMKGNSPVYEVRLGKGLQNVLGGGFDYFKFNVSLTQKFRVPRFGNVTYNIYGGRIFGDSLPFMLLELHPGNEFYTYNANGFNLMNRFEYFSDKYIGFQVEHNIEKKLINLLPFLRKVKMRQFYNIKAVWGSETKANKEFNKTELNEYQLRSLGHKTYLEIGTGFDNIFKFFRIDFVWRFAPPYNEGAGLSNVQPVQKFGIFGSLKIQL
jgi:Family of unknown function (DUF5686)/CarboxypepD_reg-like domain